MLNIKIDLTGLMELEKDLELLSRAETRKVVKQATRAGAIVVRDDAKSRAPKKSGKLAKNIIVISEKGSTASGVSVRSSGKKDSSKNAFYWRFVELGTSKQAPVPFIRPAFDATQEKAAQATINKMVEAIDKVLMK